jgi:CheY-like chemotaxis protein
MTPATGSDSIFASDESLRGQRESAWGGHDIVEPRRSHTRVLVVDDHRLIAETLVEILRNAGFVAEAAYDGWEALGVASRFSPDCVLSDVLMPRMNGVELAIAIRNKYPATTILLFSGQAGISEILQEGQHRGYQFELIPKPIHPLRLIERLKKG